jgi:pimeloyl-ACP methyl ester carboxylesterase
MFHMTASSSAAFEPLMQELDGKFPLIALDTVNYGDSYRTNVEPSIRFIVDVLLEALSALKIDRFHTYGHHTGVNIAVDMALKAPDRVASVMAHGVNYLTMEENAYCRDNYAKSNPVHVKGTQFMWAWNKVKDTMGEVIWLNPPRAAEILCRDTMDVVRAGENWHWASRAVYAYDLIAAIKRVKCPLLLIRGRREPLNSFEVQGKAVKDLPHARSYVHEEGGVYALESYPADFARAIVDFIREAETMPQAR